MQRVLGYSQWRRFKNTVSKAKTSCNNSNVRVEDHFANVGKMINLGKGGTRNINDYKLSCYACYLIAQNGNSHMKVIELTRLCWNKNFF